MTAFRTVLRMSGILALLVSLGPLARSAEDLGPPVGTTAPDIGTRLDQLGKPHHRSHGTQWPHSLLLPIGRLVPLLSGPAHRCEHRRRRDREARLSPGRALL